MEWLAGTTFLYLQPEYNNQRSVGDFKDPLMILDTLKGIRQWVETYPGVYVRFGEIYEKISSTRARSLASGVLIQFFQGGSTS